MVVAACRVGRRVGTTHHTSAHSTPPLTPCKGLWRCTVQPRPQRAYRGWIMESNARLSIAYWSRRRISTAPRARAVLARDVRVTTIRAHQKEEAEDLACQTHADAAAAEPVLPLESRPQRRPQHATPARAHDAHVGRGAGASRQPGDHPGVQRPADAVSVGPAAVERQRPERRPAAEDLRPICARANCLRSRGGRRLERPPRGRPYTRGGDCGSSPHGADRRSAPPQRRGSCG